MTRFQKSAQAKHEARKYAAHVAQYFHDCFSLMIRLRHKRIMCKQALATEIARKTSSCSKGKRIAELNTEIARLDANLAFMQPRFHAARDKWMEQL